MSSIRLYVLEMWLPLLGLAVWLLVVCGVLLLIEAWLDRGDVTWTNLIIANALLLVGAWVWVAFSGAGVALLSKVLPDQSFAFFIMDGLGLVLCAIGGWLLKERFGLDLSWPILTASIASIFAMGPKAALTIYMVLLGSGYQN